MQILEPLNPRILSQPANLTAILWIEGKCDGFLKIRHSRGGGNPESTNLLKRLDSRFHGNDEKADLRTFYEIINL